MPKGYLEDIKVLVVEDNAFMRTIVRGVLRALGARNVTEAGEGAQALKMLRTSNPDIIITDWEMQPIDGVEFVHMIRTAPDSPNPFVPVIMLSGHSEAKRVFAARDAGVNEFVVKPISARRLLARIQSVIERPRPYIRTKNYFGPDRRRTSLPFEGADRRMTAAEIAEPAKPPDSPAAPADEKAGTP